jgi:hypothetical protein
LIFDELDKPYEALFVLVELVQVLAVLKRQDQIEGLVTRATTLLRSLKFDPRSEDAVLAFLRGALHTPSKRESIRRALRALRIAGLRGRHQRPRPPGRPRRPKPPEAPRSPRSQMSSKSPHVDTVTVMAVDDSGKCFPGSERGLTPQKASE